MKMEGSRYVEVKRGCVEDPFDEALSLETLKRDVRMEVGPYEPWRR
jgi:hypothetical protein